MGAKRIDELTGQSIAADADLLILQRASDGRYRGVPVSAIRAANSTQIINGSGVDGDTVSAALDNLESALGGGGVTTVFGRSGAVVSAASDYDASQIDNDSAVAGDFVDDALNTLNTGKQSISEKGQASGYASLDGGGKIPTSQLPASVVGSVVYQGTWNATTNTPSLTDGSGAQGEYYKVSVAGSTALDGESDWKVGDWVISDGTTWSKVDNTETVSSVHGRTGAVVAVLNDYTATLIDNDSGVAGATVAAALDNLASAITASAFDGDMENGDLTNIKVASYDSVGDEGNSGASKTIDFSAGQWRKVTLTATTTLTFTPPAGPSKLILQVTQDGTGNHTITWPASVKWTGQAAADPTAAAGSVDFYTLLYDGTNYWVAQTPDFG